jgi:hypothetical protein
MLPSKVPTAERSREALSPLISSEAARSPVTRASGIRRVTVFTAPPTAPLP